MPQPRVRSLAVANVAALILATALVVCPAPAAAQELGAGASSADSVTPAAEPQDTTFQEPADSLAEEPEVKLDIGGALRLNYSYQDYNEPRQDRYGDFFFEVFMLSVDTEYEDLFLSVQYRWYNYFEAIRYGYVGFRFTPKLEAHLGISQAPFGILPWASHSFWFGATYYMGFEDDYDVGLKAIFRDGPWNVQAAFYKNAEDSDPSRTERYSFDLVTGDGQANEEVNQWNGRVAYNWKLGARSSVDIGGSAMYGGIYNQTTTETGDRHAFAVHSDFHFGTWNLQLQGLHYQFSPENPPEVDPSTVQLGAFGFPFLMASEGWEGTFNVAKDFRPGWRFLDSVKCYADLSKVFPDGPDTHTSTQIVTGCLLVKWGLYTYVDMITGQNMWFAGGPGIGLDTPTSDEWNSRLNVNFGFYF
jgi:hypothetical protein